MKRIVAICILVMAVCATTLAASKKHPTFSHKYKNARLEQVIQDIGKKTDWRIIYDVADIDADQRVNIVMKDLSAKSALRKVLGKNYDITSKKGVITIAMKPQPATTYTVVATTPYAVDETDEAIVRHYTDTTYSIVCKNRTIEEQAPAEEPKPVEQTNRGHHVQAMIGGGYIGATAQVQYAYYFHENWGVYAGLGFSGTMIHAKYSPRTITQRDVLDSDGERCDVTYRWTNWTCHYTTHAVEVPLGIQCMYPVAEKVGIYAGVGAKIGAAVHNLYRNMGGDVETSGYYAYTTHVTLPAGVHDYKAWHVDKQDAKKLDGTKLSAAVSADFGVSLRATEQVNVLLGIYGQVVSNKVFDGQSLRPYQVGLKVGVDWHGQAKPRVKKAETIYRTIQVCDTTRTLLARDEREQKPQTEAAKEIKEIMRRSVIWFDLDKTEPKLEPADIIEQIAAVLLSNPEQKIQVNGHASKEGNERHNRRLSERRAQAVYDLLLRAGVPASQMTKQSFSADVDYRDSESSESSHNIALDRRVEIVPINE